MFYILGKCYPVRHTKPALPLTITEILRERIKHDNDDSNNDDEATDTSDEDTDDNESGAESDSSEY